MNNVSHILIATDGSELSLRAARLGGYLARALDARVTILTVLDEEIVVPAAWAGVNMGVAPVPSSDSIREQHEKAALDTDLALTAAAVGELPTPATLVHVWGHKPTEICVYASENAVDLIVMGSHGRTGIKEAILGSVSHAVANRAPCAVTVVR